MEKGKGNLLNLLYLLTFPSTPETKSYAHSFSSVDELKDKSPEFKDMFSPKEFQGHYLNLILRGYDPQDRLVQVSVVQTSDAGNSIGYLVSCAEEELNARAAENNLNPEECTLAAKGIFSDPKEVYLCDLLRGKYMDIKTHSEKLSSALDLSF